MTEKSAWQKYKENLGDVRPWDLINKNTQWADDLLAKERYNICLSCPELIKTTKQCKKCVCFMAGKTKLQLAVCPISKW